MYTLSLVIYAFIMAYMLFAAGWLTYRGIDFGIHSATWTPSTEKNVALVFAQPGFRDVIVSLAATYGLYVVSSIMYLEPWHMFTSFLQYLLLLPTYINILNIYAFCNIHDEEASCDFYSYSPIDGPSISPSANSWGTKGDNQISTDLGAVVAVSSAQGKQEVEVELPSDQLDINAAYEEALTRMQKKRENTPQVVDAKTKREDDNKSFRTNLLLFWIGCNALLIAVVTSQHFNGLFISGGGGNSYLAFILWSVAAMAAFRFIGSTAYLIFRFFTD
ncbi:putative chitin synthase division I, partial [Jimgerdemannia flammicorona]